MAGRRRGTGRPCQRDARGARRRAALNEQLAATGDPRSRVALAADYLRGALALRPDAAVAEEAVVWLVETADRLYGRKGPRA